MTWIKLDESFPDHPKVHKAGPEAAWLYVAALCHSGRFLTDGFVDGDMVPKMTAIKSPKKAVQALVLHGLWIEVEGGYQINDFTEYQRTRDQVENQRERARERQARARRNHGVTGEDVTGVSRRDTSVTNGDVTEMSRRDSRRESQRSHSTEKSREERDTPPNPLADEGEALAKAIAGDISPSRQNPRALGNSPRQQAEAERLASTPCLVCKVIHDPSLDHRQCELCDGFGYIETETDSATAFDACESCKKTGQKVLTESSVA